MERDFDDNEIAERVGFEPTVPLRIHYLSRVANSTTLASLREDITFYTEKISDPTILFRFHFLKTILFFEQEIVWNILRYRLKSMVYRLL